MRRAVLHPARGRPAAARRGGPGRPEELTDPLHAPRRQPVGRLRRQPQQRQAGLRLARRHAAHPGVEHEAVHLRRPRWRASAPTGRSGRRCSATGGSTRTASGAATSTCAAAATRPSAPAPTRASSTAAATTVQQLAKLIDQAGIERVTGRVYGDESRHDSLRGGPDSGYGVSIWVGPLSALAYNRGFANEGGSAFQTNPPAFAAGPPRRRARGARHRRCGASRSRGRAPGGLDVLASVDSPPMERIVKLMNKPSDNFFAELLAKDVAMQVNGRGTTSAGAALVAGFARRLGSRAQLVDGSGLSRGNRASPYRVVRLLHRDGAARRVRRPARLAADRRPRRHARTTACAAARRARTAAPRPARCPT